MHVGLRISCKQSDMVLHKSYVSTLLRKNRCTFVFTNSSNKLQLRKCWLHTWKTDIS